MQIGLAYFCFILLVQVLLFIWTFHQIKEVHEFNFTPEMVLLCTTWIVVTNIYLFLIIQGSYSDWFTLIQCQRIVTYGLIVRSFVTSYVTCWPSIKQSYVEGAQIMPIPPNRENIESVEMVLHIPIAVDYFYDFLMNR